jgi:hypothetical protein
LTVSFPKTFFSQELPAKSDNDVLDLDPSCQIRMDLQRGLDFLSKLSRILIGGPIERNLALSDVVNSLILELKEIASRQGT